MRWASALKPARVRMLLIRFLRPSEGAAVFVNAGKPRTSSARLRSPKAMRALITTDGMYQTAKQKKINVMNEGHERLGRGLRERNVEPFCS